MSDDQASIQEDFDWARVQLSNDTLPEEAEEVLEKEFLEAVNSIEEGLTEEQAEEKFRDMVRALQATAYLAGYALGVRVTPNDGAESVVAVINGDDATALIKAMVTNQEIPLTIRVISD